MNNIKQNIPQLRFVEFTDELISDKLGNIATFIVVGNYAQVTKI